MLPARGTLNGHGTYPRPSQTTLSLTPGLDREADSPERARHPLFEKLHRHGPLSTRYLVAYSQLLRKSATRAKDRLTDLFNEDDTPHNGTYLDRPWQQFETLDARQNDLVYDLTPQSIRVLKAQGLWSDDAPHPGGSWKHTYMTAAITASIELATLQTDNVP
jgi:hypothetical protein